MLRLARLLLKGLLLAIPLAAAVLYINYTVDGSAILRGDKYELEIATAWLDGKAVGNFDNTINERSVMRLYVDNLSAGPDTLVLGSSRAMQITAAIAGEQGSFFNAGMTGADRKDILGTFYLFDRAGKLPQNLIVTADPWLLFDSEDALNYRSDDNLYREFLHRCLGYEDVTYQAEDDTLRREALISAAYFQENIRYALQDHSADARPSILPDDLLDYAFEIRTSDGAQWYSQEFRAQDQEAVDLQAMVLAGVDYAQLYGFTRIAPQLATELEDFLAYAVERGVNVTLVLTPFHPIYWQKLTTDPDYTAVAAAEQALRAMAARCGVTVYGSYDPALCGCTNADFYDGLHIRRESIARYFPGLGKPVPVFAPKPAEEEEPEG